MRHTNQTTRATLLLLGIAVVAAVSPAAVAQKKTPAAKPPAKKTTGATKKPTVAPAKPPAGSLALTTLDRALDKVAWDEKAGNALLLVMDAAHTIARPGASAPASGNWSLNRIAPLFDRKVATIGAVQVVAPATMTVINEKPGEPDVFESLSRAEKVRYLMASLSPEQWQKLGSPEGLGRADLTDAAQKKQFDALLPDPFVVSTYTRSEGSGGATAFRRQGSPVTLTGAQRAQVRLRARRGVDMLLYAADRPGAFVGFTRRYEGPEVKKFAVLDDGGAAAAATTVGGSGASETAAMEAALRKELPNEPKTGELNFADPALAAKVNLSGVYTVGELVKRASDASKMEIFADRRVARLPLTVKGTSAKAGDALKAIALAVTGTFRKIDAGAGNPPAYLLTDDLVGFGARQVTVAEWLQDAETRKRQVFDTISLQMAPLKPLEQIHFDTGDPLAPGDALMQKFEDLWKTTDPRVRLDVPFDELSPGMQTYVRAEAARRAEGSRPQPVRTDTVKVGMNLRYAFVVPGIGDVEDASRPEIGEAWVFLPRPAPLAGARPAPAMREPVALPSAIPNRSLLIAPRSGDEAVDVVNAARARGFTQLWVASNDPVVIAAAVNAAKPYPLPVYAVVRLLRPAANRQGSLDRTILDVPPSVVEERDNNKKNSSGGGNLEALMSEDNGGDNGPSPSPVGDWLAPDASNPKLLAERVAEIARIPGLAGLTLQDTLPPGYGEYEETTTFAAIDTAPASGSAAAPARLLGYTPQMRLEFLRREGVDPMDLVPPSVSGDKRLGNPFFRDESTARLTTSDPTARRWNLFKRDANRKLMASVFDAVRAAAPKLPLFIRNRWDDQQAGAADRRPVRWYAMWSSPDLLPEVSPGSGSAEDPLRRVSSQYKNLLLALTWAEPNNEQDQAWFREGLRAFAESAQENHAAQGIVVDLSEMPPDKSLSLLEGIAPPQ